METYASGLLGDSRVIVHEGGHAVHQQLMHEQGVSPFYVRGPHWMFEAYATLNEFLLYDDLYRCAKAPAAKAYFLRALIDGMAFSLFGSAEEGALEQSLYDGVVAGRINGAADIDRLSFSNALDYEIWPENDPLLAHYWISRSLMVQDPLYQVNYLYAGILAVKLFDVAKHDPRAFPARYMDMLKQGFFTSSSHLLEPVLGRSMTQQELIDADMQIMSSQISLLGDLYQKDARSRGLRCPAH